MSYNLLKGKRGIIFGALNEQSIAWKVAERAVEEGAVITLSNTPVAVRMGQVSALSEKLNCEVIAADATNARWKFWADKLILYCTLSVCHRMFVRNVLMMISIIIC